MKKRVRARQIFLSELTVLNIFRFFLEWLHKEGGSILTDLDVFTVFVYHFSPRLIVF